MAMDDLLELIARLREHGPGNRADDYGRLAALAQIAARALESAERDARRMEWFFGPADKSAWLTEYMRGMRDGWTVEQWRAAIDAAIAARKGEG
jgi:hypothetical protein